MDVDNVWRIEWPLTSPNTTAFVPCGENVVGKNKRTIDSCAVETGRL